MIGKMIVRFIDFLRNRLDKVVRLMYLALFLIVAIDAVPWIVDKEHTHTMLEKIPGFWSGFGFLACVLIIFISKFYGSLGITTREDYYDN